MKPRRMLLESMLPSTSSAEVAVPGDDAVGGEIGRTLTKLDEAFSDLLRGTTSEACVASYYDRHLGQIRKVAIKYANLDTAVEIDDLLQECYLAVYSAWKSCDPRFKFSSYLHFHLQKACCRAVIDDKAVFIPAWAGHASRYVSYSQFQKIKRHLPQEVRRECIVVSLTQGLSSFGRDEDTVAGGVVAA